jgi:HPt (histidine-containing phosphotransfer) domain-containing protein
MDKNRTHVARAAKAQRRKKPGTIEAAQRRLWEALEATGGMLEEAREVGDTDTALRCVHALTQATSAYVKVIQQVEVVARVEELERELNAQEEQMKAHFLSVVEKEVERRMMLVEWKREEARDRFIFPEVGNV